VADVLHEIRARVADAENWQMRTIRADSDKMLAWCGAVLHIAPNPDISRKQFEESDITSLAIYGVRAADVMSRKCDPDDVRAWKILITDLEKLHAFAMRTFG
jgi:hypothetical protein